MNFHNTPTIIGQLLKVTLKLQPADITTIIEHTEFTYGKAYPHVRKLEQKGVLDRNRQGVYKLADTAATKAHLETYDIMHTPTDHSQFSDN